jgi:hypothetical protein
MNNIYIKSNKKYAVCMAILMLGATAGCYTAAPSEPDHALRPHDDHSKQNLEALKLITTTINLLQECGEIKCPVKETKLVDKLFKDIQRGFEECRNLEKSYNDVKARDTILRKNHAIACMLRTILQLYSISSVELDIAKGLNVQDETECVIRELGKCLAQRNITSTNRTVRAWEKRLDPYKHVIVTLQFLVGGYLAYKGLGLLKDTFFKAVGNPPSKPNNGSKAVGNPKGKPRVDEAAQTSWTHLNKYAIVPVIGLVYAHAKDTFDEAYEIASDRVGSAWAQLRGVPFRGSNPASKSRVPLKTVPSPEYAKEHMDAIAHMILSQEVIFLQGGGTGLKSLLIYGDTGLGLLLAAGLAHEITRLAKEQGDDLVCPVATIHASQIGTKPDYLKKQLEKITRYNRSCVIVIQDLDVECDDTARDSITAQVISGIRSMTKLHEQYIVIGTARDLDNVDTVLKNGSVFGTKLNLRPTEHPEVIEACFKRAEELYGITITDMTLHQQLEKYLCTYSFTSFMNLFAAVYTKALPQIGKASLTEQDIARELALAIA